MNILKKILLPFFPNNRILKNYWWHRLALIVCLFLAFCSFLAVLLLIFSYTPFLELFPIWLGIFFVPFIYIPFAIVNFFLPSFLADTIENKAILIGCLLLIALIPTFIYRLILYIIKGNIQTREK